MGLLDSFLADPGRAPFAGAAPTVSWREDDDLAWGQELTGAGAEPLELTRRGRSHGRVALLFDPGARRPRPSQARHLWQRARPLCLPGELAPLLRDWRNELHRALLRADELATGAGLEAVLARALAGRGARFRPAGELDRVDPERDLARVAVADTQAPNRRLWAKSGRLSTYAADRSLRLRFGFGDEVTDDDSRDEPCHRALAALARATCPEVALVEGARDLWGYVAEAAGAKLYPTGTIVYWNEPEGGARLHHDAFRDDDAGGQRGVCYAQLVGRTFWLALSTGDLARRAIEFHDLLAAGEMPWLRDELGAGPIDTLGELSRDPGALSRELALPDQGRLGPLLDRGPEFTLFLVDSGHGVLLGPGDVLLLPNHGLVRTAMHSVFCASPGRTLALSFGLRQAR